MTQLRSKSKNEKVHDIVFLFASPVCMETQALGRKLVTLEPIGWKKELSNIIDVARRHQSNTRLYSDVLTRQGLIELL